MSPTAASCLVFLISHAGHCFGGGPCTVEATWAADAKVAPAVVAWSLEYAGTVVADGRVVLADRAAPARITLELPTVRTCTELMWSYHLLRQRDGHLLEEGQRPIHVYPALDWAALRAKLGAARVLVLENAPGLSGLLERAGVSHHVVSTPAELELRSADLVLVGPNRLGGTRENQTALLAAATRGAAVLVLAQRDTPSLAGFEVVQRRQTAACLWRPDHPLLAALPAEAWKSWLDGGDPVVAALTVPPQEPALEIVYWPPLAEGRTPTPLDAFLVEKQLGRGRLVLCQVPASADLEDPRTQLFLTGALEYLRTTPRPTPARAERLAASQPAKKPESRPENILGVHDE
jgi:hypothetical protein